MTGLTEPVTRHPLTEPVTLLAGGDIVTMNPQRQVLLGGAVLLRGERIADVGRTSELRAAYPQANVMDITGCVVTPGMINAHQHFTGDPLVRSCIPDLLPPGASIFEWAVPIHAHHTAADDELSASVCAVESLLNGVTMVVEAGTVAHPDAVAGAMSAAGLRGTIGTWGWDVVDAPFAGTVDEVIDRQRSVLDRFPPGGLIEGWVTLIGHDLASDELLAAASALAQSRATRLTMHMSPASNDGDAYLARCGRRPLVHLSELGVLGEHLLIAHGVWLDDEEVELVLNTATAIAYCPWAYLRLGQGVTRAGRHGELIRRGGRIALGCDSSNAGDSADILRTAALAAGLARDMSLDPEGFGAHDAFALATIDGANAIGMGARIGSIEVGKQADIVVHRTDRPGWQPRGDLGLQLVWGTDGRSVRDVWVAGRQVVSDGTCVTIDSAAMYSAAAEAQTSLLRRAGITPTTKWPQTDAR